MKQITTGKDLAEYLDKNKDEEIKLFKGKMKAKPNKPFSMIFESSFSELLSKHNFCNTDFRVLFKVMEYVSFGNVINLTQQTIADDLNIKQQQVSRSFKKLEEAEVFFKHKGSLFMNPNYINKGDLNKAKENDAYKIVRNKTYKELEEKINDVKQLQEEVYKKMSF
jgi:predicted transcriptional regulator